MTIHAAASPIGPRAIQRMIGSHGKAYSPMLHTEDAPAGYAGRSLARFAALSVAHSGQMASGPAVAGTWLMS